MSFKNSNTASGANIRLWAVVIGTGIVIGLFFIFYCMSQSSDEKSNALQAAKDLGSAMATNMIEQHPPASPSTFKRNDVLSVELSDAMSKNEESLTGTDLNRARSVTAIEIEVIGENVIGDYVLRIKAEVNGSEQEFITTILYSGIPRGLVMKRLPSDPSKWEVRTDGSEYDSKPSAWLYVKIAKIADMAVQEATSGQAIKDAWEKEKLRVNASK